MPRSENTLYGRFWPSGLKHPVVFSQITSEFSGFLFCWKAVEIHAGVNL